ncbi:MAG TPA: decarboxylating 6-phosphogluconate dehydrogenase [Rhizomicrobium sp.]|jgi:6-phosphogluconate dehydrogenase|nr:decarboxylating 6-phosphogluconate dehydrogenase [Rhizomicrobium sp.]
MQIGIVGLGRMGANIGRRLMKKNHKVVAFDRDPKAVKALEGATGAASLKEMVEKLQTPRAIWVMLPAGKITDDTVMALGDMLQSGDVVIDGGNSFYKDDIRRGKKLKEKNIAYVDCGTSGGVWGLDRGYCMMIGGDKDVVTRLDPIFATLAPGEGSIDKTPGRDGRDPRVIQGYMYCGPVGSGHFVKMVHNGVEYGLMQAYAEGFDILRGRAGKELPEDERFTLDTADIAEVWRRGSVVASWLLDLTAIALAKSPGLKNFEGDVADSGEGRWTVEAAIDEAVAAPVITSALYARFRSRIEHSFGEKLLSAMRNEFGGHVESITPAHKAKDDDK